MRPSIDKAAHCAVEQMLNVNEETKASKMHGTWLFAVVVNNMQPDVREGGDGQRKVAPPRVVLIVHRTR